MQNDDVKLRNLDKVKNKYRLLKTLKDEEKQLEYIDLIPDIFKKLLALESKSIDFRIKVLSHIENEAYKADIIITLPEEYRKEEILKLRNPQIIRRIDIASHKSENIELLQTLSIKDRIDMIKKWNDSEKIFQGILTIPEKDRKFLPPFLREKLSDKQLEVLIHNSHDWNKSLTYCTCMKSDDNIMNNMALIYARYSNKFEQVDYMEYKKFHREFAYNIKNLHNDENKLLMMRKYDIDDASRIDVLETIEDEDILVEGIKEIKDIRYMGRCF